MSILRPTPLSFVYLLFSDFPSPFIMSLFFFSMVLRNNFQVYKGSKQTLTSILHTCNFRVTDQISYHFWYFFPITVFDTSRWIVQSDGTIKHLRPSSVFRESSLCFLIRVSGRLLYLKYREVNGERRITGTPTTLPSSPVTTCGSPETQGQLLRS